MRGWRQWLIVVAMIAGMVGVARADGVPSQVRLASETWLD